MRGTTGTAVHGRAWPALLVLSLALPLWPQGRIDYLAGSLALKRGSEPARPLTLNARVEQGDEVVTGPNSQADLVTSDGATVRVFPNSRVLVPKASAGRRFLHLLLGSVKVEIEKRSGRANPHTMTTPTAVIAVRGTIFSVFVEEDESTRVAVDEGSVSVTNADDPSQTVTVGRGRQTRVVRGQRPERPQRFSGPSEGAAATPFPSAGRSPSPGAGSGPGPGSTPDWSAPMGGGRGGAGPAGGRGPRR